MSRYTTEQYEAMARAAGYEVWWSAVSEMFCRSPGMADPLGIVTGIEWNPATDLADNYRLMVDAEIALEYYDEFVCGFTTATDPISVSYKDHNGDKLAATMTAVCECAIMIEEQMK